MAKVGNLTVQISARRKWFFWPFLITARVAIAMGLSPDKAAELVVKRAMVLSVSDVKSATHFN